MENIPYDLLLAIVGGMVEPLVGALAPKVKRLLKGDEQRQALERSLTAGLAALFARVTATLPDDAPTRKYIHVRFSDFLSDEDVAWQLAAPLRAEPLDMDALRTYYAEFDYDDDTLPGLSLEEALHAFEGGFVLAAMREPTLQGLIQSSHARLQSDLQRQILETLRDFVAAWREHAAAAPGISAGSIVGPSASISFQWRPVGAPEENDVARAYLREVRRRANDLTDAALLIGRKAADGSLAVRTSDVFTTLNVARALYAPNPLAYREPLMRAPSQSVEDTLRRRKQPDQERSDTMMGRQREDQLPISAIAALAVLPRCVVLGVPGGGKSTLVNHLAATFAARRLSEPCEPLDGWPDGASPLPVVIVLRRLSAWLSRHPREGGASAGDMWDYLAYEFKRWALDAATVPWVKQQLQQSAIFFFDGLDEVSDGRDEHHRTQLIALVRDFVGTLDDLPCRVVITCREYAYRPGSEDKPNPWRLPEAAWPIVPLALFDQDQMAQFVAAWYGRIGPQLGWFVEQIERESGDLIRQLHERDDLRELGHFPILLTLMVQMHGAGGGGELPRNRVKLYGGAVELQLARWENRLLREDGNLSPSESDNVDYVNEPLDTIKDVLASVALTIHQNQVRSDDPAARQKAADIAFRLIFSKLKARLGNDAGRADKVLTYISERVRLLQALDNDTFSFPHRTFQEYFAALGISKGPDPKEFLLRAVGEDLTWWREVFLLAAATRDPSDISFLVTQLLQLPDDASDAAERVLLAEQLLHESGFASFDETDSVQRYRKQTISEVGAALQRVMEAPDTVPAPQRAAAGVALARVGDERREVMTVAGMPFCLVPAGPFVMGSVSKEGAEHYDPEAWDDESPQEVYDIPYDYWISRYPVTNAQYAAFVAAGGYADETLWQEARAAGVWKKGLVQDRDCPVDYGAPYNLPNHPVVGVTWYEALAFTRWMETCRGARRAPDAPEWHLALPSEPEWEKAARGGLKIPEAGKAVIQSLADVAKAVDPALRDNPDPRRRRPWEGAADPNRANYDETGIGTTSAVGCFPNGASPYGVEEMVGNVLEWTRSLWQGYPYPSEEEGIAKREDSALHNTSRVLRGGAFNLDRRDARVAFRNFNHPSSLSRNFGFRVVLVVRRPHNSGL